MPTDRGNADVACVNEQPAVIFLLQHVQWYFVNRFVNNIAQSAYVHIFFSNSKFFFFFTLRMGPRALIFKSCNKLLAP